MNQSSPLELSDQNLDGSIISLNVIIIHCSEL